MSNSIDQNSFMKSLFFGQIREDLIFPYPKLNNEQTETVAMILDSFDRFAKDQIRSAEWDHLGEMPQEILAQLGELGILGMIVPESLGGLGISQAGYARVMQEIAGVDGSVATTMGAHQSIGYKALLLFGTEDQKQKFLPRLATGELIACYGLTEPGSGSDAASIKTRAVLSPDGKYFTITGNKLWITNAGVASCITVFAKTEVEEKGIKKDKVTCFFLELPADGVTIGPAEDKLGLRASWTNAVYFDQVRVPVENVIGGIGQGFKVAMGVLNHGRLGLAAGCIGGAKNALKAAVEHANERVQFKKKIGEFGMIREKIARMTMNLYAAESILYMTTSLVDRKTIDYSIESAIAKVFASEMLWESVDENLQIWAGAGYMKEYPYERWLRDARINRIFEGTNEIMRAYIALAGMQGPGQELAGLAEAIQYPLKGIGLVSDFAIRKIKQNIFGQNISQAHPSLKKMAAILEECAVDFANQVEALLRKHGKEISTKQLEQKRVADIAIDFFAMACVLSRVTRALQDQTSENPSTNPAEICRLEVGIAEGFFKAAHSRIRGNFRAFSKNGDDAIELISDRIYEAGRYPFDALKG